MLFLFVCGLGSHEEDGLIHGFKTPSKPHTLVRKVVFKHWTSESNADLSGIQADTGTKEPVQYERDGLVTYEEASKVIETIEFKGAHNSMLAVPYMAQDIPAVLTRNYQVLYASWGVGSTGWTLSFPGALFAIDQIREKLNTFRFFKADVEYEIRLQATTFHLGSLMVTHLPYSKLGMSHATNKYVRQYNDPVILSAAAAGGCTRSIPWVHPYNMLDTSTWQPGEMGNIWIDVLNGLGQSGPGDVTNVSITVFAHFKNIVLGGYSYETVSPVLEAHDRELNVYNGTYIPHGAVQTTLGRIESNPVLDTIASVASPAYVVLKGFRRIAGVGGDPDNYAEEPDWMEIDGWVREESGAHKSEQKEKKKKVKPKLGVPVTKEDLDEMNKKLSALAVTSAKQNEAVRKSEKGLLSGLVEAAGAASPLIAATGIGAEYAPLVGVGAAILGPILAGLGLSQPLDVMAPVRYTYKPPYVPAQGSGLIIGDRLALRQDTELASSHIMGSDSAWTLQRLISRPSLISILSFDSTTPPDTQWARFNLNPTAIALQISDTIYPSYLASCSQLFGYWRGSIKIMFQFITSGFTTTRVRISHLPTPNAPTSYETTQGSYPSAIVDIRGDTTVAYNFPYIDPRPYCNVRGVGVATPGAAPDSWVHISIVNPVIIPDAGGVSTVYLNVWAAAGEDFQFQQFTSLQLSHASTYLDMELLPPPSATVSSTKPPPRQRVIEVEEKHCFRHPTSFMNFFDCVDDIVEVEEYHSLVEQFMKPFNPIVPARLAVEKGAVNTEAYSSIYELCRRTVNSGLVVNMNMDPVSWNPTFNFFSRMFLFYRGGLRVSYYTSTLGFVTNKNPCPDPNSNLAWGSGCVMEPTQALSGSANYNNFTIEMPWYRPYNFEELEEYLNFGRNVNQQLVNSQVKATSFCITPAEDFQFGYVCAPAPWVLTSASRAYKIEERLSYPPVLDSIPARVNDDQVRDFILQRVTAPKRDSKSHNF